LHGVVVFKGTVITPIQQIDDQYAQSVVFLGHFPATTLNATNRTQQIPISQKVVQVNSGITLPVFCQRGRRPHSASVQPPNSELQTPNSKLAGHLNYLDIKTKYINPNLS
jgi:hypothetical protein